MSISNATLSANQAETLTFEDYWVDSEQGNDPRNHKPLETTKEYVSPAELAVLYLGLGDREQALSLLEQAYTEHDFGRS